MEDAGAGAVVLHSLFEEQVVVEQQQLDTYLQQGTEQFADSVKSIQGIMSSGSAEHPEAYVRANYLQILGSYTPDV